MRSLYCTADQVATPTGGGAVTANEIEALGAVSQELVILSARELQPALYAQPESPFAYDHFALHRVQEMGNFDLAHFYSGTFSNTVRWLKSQGGVVTYTVPAHDRRVTVEEHRLQGLDYPYPHISDDRLWRLFSRGYRDADIVVAPSSLAARFLEAEGCQDVRVIPHGCWPPERVAGMPQEFTAGYLGQVGIDKGLIYLLKAWESLNYRDATLVLAGPGTDSLGPYIQANVNGGKIKLLGFVPDVSAFYASVSVYVQCSVCESFGIEILEALACGRPVIASEGAGASELVEEGMGFRAPIRDPAAIARAIAWCRQHRGSLAEMGQKGRKKAEEYSWLKIRSKYQQMWATVCPSDPDGR